MLGGHAGYEDEVQQLHRDAANLRQHLADQHHQQTYPSWRDPMLASQSRLPHYQPGPQIPDTHGFNSYPHSQEPPTHMHTNVPDFVQSHVGLQFHLQSYLLKVQM